MGANEYFKILGIAPTKDEKIIKKAYRKLALRYHPDKNDSKVAQQRFIEITDAYECLLRAIEHANRTLEQRAEFVRENKRRNQSARPSRKTQQEIYEERLKEARRRYEEMRAKEQAENEAYYQMISSGYNWKLFRFVMIGCLLLAVLFTLDNTVLPSRWEQSEVVGTNRVINYGGIHYRRVVPVQLQTGDKMWVKPSFSASLSHFKTVYVERSFIFRDIKKLWIWESGKWYTNVADFSVSGTFPIMPLFLFIPFITFMIKGRTLTYSLLFNISLYMYGAILITLLISNDRWAHLITLGFI